jgi:hypothetical protein
MSKVTWFSSLSSRLQLQRLRQSWSLRQNRAREAKEATGGSVKKKHTVYKAIGGTVRTSINEERGE